MQVHHSPAPVLAYPIIKVRKVVKRTIIFDEWKAPAAPALATNATLAGAALVSAKRPVFSTREAREEENFSFVLLAVPVKGLALNQWYVPLLVLARGLDLTMGFFPVSPREAGFLSRRTPIALRAPPELPLQPFELTL